MDSTVTMDDVPSRFGTLDSQQAQSTRETESLNSELCTMPRPPPTGEDSSETIRSKEAVSGSSKAECPSPRLTPRRYTAKELPASYVHTSDEDKLAPLGFEPEGEAVSTPTFREAGCFSDMLSDSEACFIFYQYLRRINCHILLDFCRACDEFRAIVNTAPQKLSTGKAIFQQYVASRGTCDQLGIKPSSRSKIAELISVQPIDPQLFEEACSQVVANMKNLHYKAFLNSSFFKDSEVQVESKIINEPYNRRYQSGGYLPTLPEEKVLGFGDEMEDFEYEQHSKNSKRPLYVQTNSTSDEKNARKLLHIPIKDVSSSPYYYPTAPLASITESESISSDALTDDTLSMTTDTSDGTRYSGGRRAHRSSRTAQQRYPFIPRTHRMPKEARQPLNPEEFAKILTEKLEKVKLEQQMQEREAINLSQSLDVERPGSSQSKKSILQEAIENKERRDKIPLSTMVHLPMQDDSSSISTSNHSSSKSTSARATAGSAAHNSSSSESTHRKYRNTRHAHKSSKHENEPVNRINEQLPPNVHKEPKVIRNVNLPNEEIPFLTANHHRIQEWMATGEEELKKQKPKSHQSKSRQSSSSCADSYGGHHQPLQPIAQDPMMPLLHGPEATTVLSEVSRRLMETKEQDRKSKQRHRSRNSVEDSSDQSSYYGKASTTDVSSCSQSLLSYDLNQHQSYSSLPSSASNMGNDTKSRSDSGIGGGVRKKEKHNATTLIYWLWGEPIAYRTSLPGRHITLGQFKTQLTPRRGEFRYFFKTKTDERDCEVTVVYEEVRDDNMELPTFDGKIIGKVEKVD